MEPVAYPAEDTKVLIAIELLRMLSQPILRRIPFFKTILQTLAYDG